MNYNVNTKWVKSYLIVIKYVYSHLNDESLSVCGQVIGATPNYSFMYPRVIFEMEQYFQAQLQR